MKRKPQLTYSQWLKIMTDRRPNVEVARAYKRSTGNVSQLRSGEIYKHYYDRYMTERTITKPALDMPQVHWTITQPWGVTA